LKVLQKITAEHILALCVVLSLAAATGTHIIKFEPSQDVTYCGIELIQLLSGMVSVIFWTSYINLPNNSHQSLCNTGHARTFLAIPATFSWEHSVAL
jgi:hypothetical protein